MTNMPENSGKKFTTEPLKGTCHQYNYAVNNTYTNLYKQQNI